MIQRITMLLTAFLVCLITITAQSHDKKEGMNQDEFKQKYQNFIIQQAKLTQEEALAFFPIYHECQEKKHKLNDRIWKLHREAREKELTEQDYQRIIEEIANLRIQIDELDKSYVHRYHEVLSYKKIFDVQGAEARFHREMLKKMHHPKKREPERKK